MISEIGSRQGPKYWNGRRAYLDLADNCDSQVGEGTPQISRQSMREGGVYPISLCSSRPAFPLLSAPNGHSFQAQGQPSFFAKTYPELTMCHPVAIFALRDSNTLGHNQIQYPASQQQSGRKSMMITFQSKPSTYVSDDHPLVVLVTRVMPYMVMMTLD